MTRRHERMVRRKCNIPVTTAALIDEMFRNPATNQPTYGAFSRLCSALLAEHLRICGIKTLDDARGFRLQAAATPTPMSNHPFTEADL